MRQGTAEPPRRGCDARAEDVVRDALAPYGIAVEDGPALRGLVLHVDQLVRRSDGQLGDGRRAARGRQAELPVPVRGGAGRGGSPLRAARRRRSTRASSASSASISASSWGSSPTTGRASRCSAPPTAPSTGRFATGSSCAFGDRACVRVFARAAEALDAARAGTCRPRGHDPPAARAAGPARAHLPAAPVRRPPRRRRGRCSTIAPGAGGLAQLRSTRPFFSEELFVRMTTGPRCASATRSSTSCARRLAAAGAVGAGVRARPCALAGGCRDRPASSSASPYRTPSRWTRGARRSAS